MHWGNQSNRKPTLPFWVIAALLALSITPVRGQDPDPAEEPPTGSVETKANTLFPDPPSADPHDPLAPQFSGGVPGALAADPQPAGYSAGQGYKVSLFNDTSSLVLQANFSLLGIASTSRALVPWNPLLMFPASPYGLNTNTFDLHGRQTNFQGIFSGPEMFGFQTGAFTRIYLQNGSLTSDTYGLLPAVAFADMKNEDWRFAVGLQPDVFTPRDPVMIPTSLLAASGNPGTFRGQIRAERFFHLMESTLQTVTLALSEPISTILIDANKQNTEDNGWPNIEARLNNGFGEVEELTGGRKERWMEAGISGVVGQVRTTRTVWEPSDLTDPTPPRNIVNVWGGAIDTRINLTRSFGLVGEVYMGQGLGTYMASIAQVFNPVTKEAVRSNGFWAEAFWYLTDQVHWHAGYGLENPNPNDLPANQPYRNQTYFTSLFWDINRSVQWSCEVDYRQTNYFAPIRDGSGAIFYTQFLWRF